MECKEVLENLVAFLDGELDKDLNAQISRHMESCNLCTKEARLLSKTWHILDKFPELEPNEKIIRQIQEKVRAINNQKPDLLLWRWRWVRIAVLSTAAGLIITLGIHFMVTGLKPLPDLKVVRAGGQAATTYQDTKIDANPVRDRSPLGDRNNILNSSGLVDNISNGANSKNVAAFGEPRPSGLEDIEIKLNYYKTLLARFQEIKEEDYWCGDDLKAISPYLFYEEWDF